MRPLASLGAPLLRFVFASFALRGRDPCLRISRGLSRREADAENTQVVLFFWSNAEGFGQPCWTTMGACMVVAILVCRQPLQNAAGIRCNSTRNEAAACCCFFAPNVNNHSHMFDRPKLDVEWNGRLGEWVDWTCSVKLRGK